MGSLYIGDVEVIGGGGGGGGGKYVDVLVVGGGGGGAGCYGSGGGGGGLIECKRYAIFDNNITVTVGLGGQRGNNQTQGCNGGDSSFDNLIAYGGGAGGVCLLRGKDGGNGGGGYQELDRCYLLTHGGAAKNVGGHQGGGGQGGGGGAGGDGSHGVGGSQGQPVGLGGQGLYSDITGEGCFYSGGGNSWIYSCRYISCGSDYCGGGGYGCCSGTGASSGKNGIVVVRYPTSGSYGITSATGGCKYTCGDYTIHCFTSDGTFTIN